MNLEPFQKILKKVMGLAPDSLGKSGVQRALQTRMRALGCNENQYLNLLRNDEKEVSELVEEIVVPETWFFRDTKPFELLSETAVSCRQGCYKVLSAPCSTGEEPYSVAMSLMGAGLPLSRIQVDAVDISNRALGRAKEGVYTENSFRADIPFYAQGCFEKCERGRKLTRRVREAVNFFSGNIVAGCLPPGQYDAIFCRNLIIYLDEKSRECLVELFSEKLKKEGLLFVGHAEALPIFNKYFIPVRKPGVFAFRKTDRVKPEKKGVSPLCTRAKCPERTIGKDKTESEQTKKSPTKVSLIKKDVPQVSENNKVLLEDIKILANRGETDKSLSLCLKLLACDGPEPNLLQLCGLLYETQGDAMKAEEYYGKALYLNPNHLDSLVHLSLLLENRGESRKAELLRNRVRRAENKNEAR